MSVWFLCEWASCDLMALFSQCLLYMYLQMFVCVIVADDDIECVYCI